jgi:hypothetical protein
MPRVKYDDLPPEFARQLREERRQERAHARALVEACRRGDAEQFYELAFPYDHHPAFWPGAVRAISRAITEVTPDIQQAFLQIWVETKMLNLRVDDNRALCRALRILLPPYKGEALRLYRGAGALERRRAAYGISWTSNLSMAEQFAESYRVMNAGSVVLATVAPPGAIISAVEYPPPMTEEETAELGLPPTAKIVEWHEEAEYLVDRRMLGPVSVLRRYRKP